MFDFLKAKARDAVSKARADQLAHEAGHPEPYDAGQRREAILIRARYLLKQAGRRCPNDLDTYV